MYQSNQNRRTLLCVTGRHHGRAGARRLRAGISLFSADGGKWVVHTGNVTVLSAGLGMHVSGGAAAKGGG